MTTIAYRDGVLAADTRCVRRGTIGVARKLFCGAGWIAGACGEASDIHHFMRWYQAGADLDNLPTFLMYGDEETPSVEALIVTRGGVERWTHHFQPTPVLDPYCAVGSGEQFATAAMYMGATAEEAVRVAMALDPGTGGTIEVLTFDPPTPRLTP